MLESGPPLGCRLTVGRLTLDQVVGVRIPAPQPRPKPQIHSQNELLGQAPPSELIASNAKTDDENLKGRPHQLVDVIRQVGVERVNDNTIRNLRDFPCRCLFILHAARSAAQERTSSPSPLDPCVTMARSASAFLFATSSALWVRFVRRKRRKLARTSRANPL
jgi:hypothetical protein